MSRSRAATRIPPPEVPTIRERLNRLVLSTALPAALFAACALGAGYWVAWGAVESSLSAAASSLSGAIDSRLLRLQTGLQAFALVERVDPARTAELREHALAFQRSVDAVNVVVVREDGAHLMNTLVPEGQPLPQEPPNAFHAQVVRDQRPVIRDLFRGPAMGGWLSAIAVPARSATGDRYVIGASLTPQQILSVLRAQQLPEGWIAAVLDRQGTLVARTPDNRLVGLRAVSGLRDALARSQRGVGLVTAVGGVQLLTAYQRSEETGWSVAIGIPLDALWIPALKSVGWITAAGLLTLLGSLVLARRLGGRIAGSMIGLSRLASAVGGPSHLSWPRLEFREALDVAEVLDHSDRQLKVALASSEASRARLRAIIDTAVDAVVVLDGQDRVEVVNPAAASMFGYGTNQMAGLPVDRLLPTWDASLDSAEPHLARLRGRRSDGSDFPAQAAISRGVAGGAVFVTVIVRDVTLEERTREELLRSNHDLQRFASVASHDMRSPLRTLQGFLTVASETPDLPEARRRDLLQRCLRAVRQLDHLTGSLLSFARLNATPPEPEPVDLGEVAREVAELLHASIEAASAQVHICELPVVSGVRGELVQLLQNLVGNAIQYRKPDVPPLVTIEAVPAAGGWELCVADNGIGIAPAYHQKIFEMFQRLHARNEQPGSGIGLASCARIALRHGGRIWVESEEGQGARFKVLLHGAPGAA